MPAKHILPMLLAFTLVSTAAYAGPQFIDNSGYAISGYDVVEYWNLKQAPIGKGQPKAVPGKASITAEYNGAKWAFRSEKNRKAFLANPIKYAPAYDGHCAYGAAQGGKVPGNAHLWRIVNDKLYLNINQAVVGFWTEDIPGNISKGNENWMKTLEDKPSQKKNAPNFDHTKAPL